MLQTSLVPLEPNTLPAPSPRNVAPEAHILVFRMSLLGTEPAYAELPSRGVIPPLRTEYPRHVLRDSAQVGPNNQYHRGPGEAAGGQASFPTRESGTLLKEE